MTTSEKIIERAEAIAKERQDFITQTMNEIKKIEYNDAAFIYYDMKIAQLEYIINEIKFPI